LPLELPNSLTTAVPTSLQQLAYPPSELLSRQLCRRLVRPPGMGRPCTDWRHWTCYHWH